MRPPIGAGADAVEGGRVGEEGQLEGRLGENGKKLGKEGEVYGPGTRGCKAEASDKRRAPWREA